MIGMIKMSDKCQKQYDFAEKKCLSEVKAEESIYQRRNGKIKKKKRTQ